jgi:fermentation-respiration switch protein FrsA (DUF1100 family)
MFEPRDVEFAADDGLVLRGWLLVPHGGDRPRAAITMAHAYAGVKEQGIEPFAKAFADAGFIVLLHDHRNFGASDGAIRGGCGIPGGRSRIGDTPSPTSKVSQRWTRGASGFGARAMLGACDCAGCH